AGLPSRVVAISLKDRAAILMGGHRADAAVWLDVEHFQWSSSRFYFPDGKLPVWVNELNQALTARKGQNYEWKPAGRATGYSAPNTDILMPSWGKTFFGTTFPHSAPIGSTSSIASPFGLEMTELAAEKAVDAYHLGTSRATDLLAVSFSSHDYM